MSVSDGVSPSPKGGGAEPARPPLNPPLAPTNKRSVCPLRWSLTLCSGMRHSTQLRPACQTPPLSRAEAALTASSWQLGIDLCGVDRQQRPPSFLGIRTRAYSKEFLQLHNLSPFPPLSNYPFPSFPTPPSP